MTALELKRVAVSLGGTPILRGCDLAVGAGGFVGLIGPNGAGKTTLLRAASALLSVDAGQVSLDGMPLSSLPPRQRARRLGYLPQAPAAHWPMTVDRLVALGRMPHLEPWRRPSDGDAAAIEQALRDADVADLRHRVFHTLSGGERVRAMLARVLAGEPDVLLADEPLASLDPYHQFQVIALLRRLADAGHAVLAVLHDLTLAARFCHRLALLDDGRIVADGVPADVLSADNLRRVYRISAWIDGADENLRIVPRATVGADGEGAA